MTYMNIWNNLGLSFPIYWVEQILVYTELHIPCTEEKNCLKYFYLFDVMYKQNKYLFQCMRKSQIYVIFSQYNK